jgi:hypothetical protein
VQIAKVPELLKRPPIEAREMNDCSISGPNPSLEVKGESRPAR